MCALTSSNLEPSLDLTCNPDLLPVYVKAYARLGSVLHHRRNHMYMYANVDIITT
jgi:hypothetical protein